VPRPNFKVLSRRLVEAGVAQHFADRIRSELQDHFADLEEELMQAQRIQRRAALEARRRLGSNDAIVAEFMKRPELFCWVYRSRWLLHLLRAVSLVLLFFRAVSAGLAAWRPALLRYALAAGLALAVTTGILFALQWSIFADEPRIVRTAGRIDRLGAAKIETGRYDAGTAQVVLVSAGSLGTVSDARPGAVGAERRSRTRAADRIARPAPASVAFDARIESPALDALKVERPDANLAAVPMKLSDSELLPIVKVAPSFPAFAAERGIEGYVIVEYTVTALGTVRDIVVIESSNAVFVHAAVEAAAKFKYKPRVIGGQAVAVRGVRTRVTFTLAA
jgi:TonB family protein